jgi:hypothetical protein
MVHHDVSQRQQISANWKQFEVDQQNHPTFLVAVLYRNPFQNSMLQLCNQKNLPLSVIFVKIGIQKNNPLKKRVKIY